MAFKLKGFPKIQGTLSARQRDELAGDKPGDALGVSNEAKQNSLQEHLGEKTIKPTKPSKPSNPGDALGITQEARRNPDLMHLEEYLEFKGKKPMKLGTNKPAEPSRPAEPGYKNIPESMRPPMPTNDDTVEGMTQFEYDAKGALKPVLDVHGNIVDKVRTAKGKIGGKIKKKAGDIYDYFTEK